jgi:hypothetical protein
MTREQYTASVWLFNHYTGLAKKVWDIYPCLADAYVLYDHYMGYVDKCKRDIERYLEN